MVIVDYPDDTCRKFFKFQNTLFGPIDSNGVYRAVQIELPLTGERFEPNKGIYDENSIVHSSFHGRIFYYPILADCIPNPMTGYPRIIKVPILEYPYTVTALSGFACPDIGAMVTMSPMTYSWQTVRRTESNWILTKLIQVTNGSSMCGVYRWHIRFVRWVSQTQIQIGYQFSISQSPVTIPFDKTREATCEQIETAASLVKKWTNYTETLQTLTVYTTDPSAVVSPKTLEQNLEVFVDQLMNAEFPIQESDYGELAARAVKQRKLIDSNIIEFLRDLPHAKDMIPKLKNLSKLKTYAGNFLAVKYGVLPTVDDLSKIVGAFRNRKEYFDKYANTIYNASNTAELVAGNSKFTLKQYIKVPVSNEDCLFLQLVEELDKIGLGLTFENVWDLVKYSFVIDWFIDVGGFLERIDENLRLLRYNIPYVTMSRKKVIYGEIPQQLTMPVIGPIEWRFYHRWVSSHCPLPPLTLSTSPTASDHWLEAGALIIQRAR